MGKGDNFRKAAPNVTDVRIMVVDGKSLPPEDENDLHLYRRNLEHDLPKDLENFLLTRYNSGSAFVRIITGRGGKRYIFEAVGKILAKLQENPDTIIEAHSPESSSANGSYIITLKK